MSETKSLRQNFSTGDLVWSKMGEQWWPCLVCTDPKKVAGKKKDKNYWIGVKSFEKEPSWEWTKEKFVKPFNGSSNKDCQRGAAYFSSTQKWKDALMEADKAMLLDFKERLHLMTAVDFIHFIINSPPDNSPSRDFCREPPAKRIRVTESDGDNDSDHTSLSSKEYDDGDVDNCNNEESSKRRKRKRKGSLMSEKKVSEDVVREEALQEDESSGTTLTSNGLSDDIFQSAELNLVFEAENSQLNTTILPPVGDHTTQDNCLPQQLPSDSEVLMKDTRDLAQSLVEEYFDSFDIKKRLCDLDYTGEEASSLVFQIITFWSNSKNKCKFRGCDNLLPQLASNLAGVSFCEGMSVVLLELADYEMIHDSVVLELCARTLIAFPEMIHPISESILKIKTTGQAALIMGVCITNIAIHLGVNNALQLWKSFHLMWTDFIACNPFEFFTKKLMVSLVPMQCDLELIISSKKDIKTWIEMVINKSPDVVESDILNPFIKVISLISFQEEIRLNEISLNLESEMKSSEFYKEIIEDYSKQDKNIVIDNARSLAQDEDFSLGALQKYVDLLKPFNILTEKEEADLKRMKISMMTTKSQMLMEASLQAFPVLKQGRTTVLLEGNFYKSKIVARKIKICDENRWENERQSHMLTEGSRNVLKLLFQLKSGNLYNISESCQISLDNVQYLIQLHKEERLSLAKQVVLALHQLHSAKIVHSDLSPAHILIKQSGGRNTLLVSNFRRSRAVLDENSMTFDRSLNGTGTEFLDPEIMNQTNVVTFSHKTDVYTGGLLIYFIIEGRMASVDRDDLRQDIEKCQSDEIRHILYKMLAEKQNERPNGLELVNFPFMWKQEKFSRFCELLVRLNVRKDIRRFFRSPLDWEEFIDLELYRDMAGHWTYSHTHWHLVCFLRHLDIHFHQTARAKELFGNKNHLHEAIPKTQFLKIFDKAFKHFDNIIRGELMSFDDYLS